MDGGQWSEWSEKEKHDLHLHSDLFIYFKSFDPEAGQSFDSVILCLVVEDSVPHFQT